ncbi:2081_t:CDS:2, partial [Paraglomus occultum]
MTRPTDQRPITPLPRKQLFILCCCRFAEPIAFTNILPFLYFMVEDFHLTDDPKKIGYFVGYIASSFALCQFFTGLPWGFLSDRIGRRPVILTGLLGTMTSSLLFGLSTSFTWAILSRSLCGILNGNVGVIKSMLAELTDETNQATAFSFLPFMYGIGIIIGPMLGGFLAKPAEQYPSIFGNCPFLKTYPYFLPCFVASLICLFGFTIGFFFLEETLESKKKQKSKSTLFERTEAADKEERAPLIPKDDPPPENPSFRDILCKPVLVMVLSYVFLALQTIMYDGIYNLWCATPVKFGGLGFSTKEIGISLSCAGLFTLTWQLFVYPKTQRKFGTLNCYRTALSGYMLVYFFQPFVNVVAKKIEEGAITSIWLWPFLLLFVFGNRICCVTAFTSSMILVTNVAPTKAQLGSVHGLTQTMGSGVRAIGPASAGTLFALSLQSPFSFPFDKHFVWTILAVIALVSRLESNLVIDPKAKNSRQEAVEVDVDKK